MKRSGTTWSDDGAQDILSLRTAYLNGGWDRPWADEQPLRKRAAWGSTDKQRADPAGRPRCPERDARPAVRYVRGREPSPVQMGDAVKLWTSRVWLTLALAASCVAAAPSTQPATQPADRPVRVAIYTDGGAPDGPKSGPANVIACLSKLRPGHYLVEKVKGDDIRHGALDRFEVAVFPGGSGSGQAKSLEPEGRVRVREFVRRGGGYLGICGGAYLGTSYYPWSLNIVNARVIDRQHWARGDPAPVKLELTAMGNQRLDQPAAEVDCIYHQGPLLGPGDRRDLPAYQPLATFGTEITQRAPKGVMIGTTAVAQSVFGHGHVILISPHPERSPGLDGFIRGSVDWLAQGPAPTSATADDAGNTPAVDPTTAPTTAPTAADR